jgi:hypothetical protein
MRSTISAAGGMSWINPTASPAITAATAAGMIVDQATSGKRRRPDIVARQVKDNAARRAAAARIANTFFGFVCPVAFLARIKAGAEQHAGSTQHHHRRQPASVANAACRHDRHAPGREVNDSRHDVDGGARRAVATGFSTLRDQNVRTGLQRQLCHVFGLHLADQPRAGGLDARHERPGIAKRQHDRARLGIERDIEQFGLLGETPRDEADAKWCGGALL